MPNHDHDQPNHNNHFNPPPFLVYYVQRLFIWGDWSMSSARYSYRRELPRYQRYQAQQDSHSDHH